MNEFFKTENWKVVHTEQLPAVEAKYFSYDDVPIATTAKNYLVKKFPKGIYEHQKLAIKEYLNSKHVCLTTGTASGKSLAFYLPGIDLLTKIPDSKIIAIYPLRALVKEQEERWKKAFDDAGIEATVGRIDGQISVQERLGIIRRVDVLITTPDIIHAWMFSQISQRPVQDFLKKLNLIIVDEVHTYTGVFGSNCGFLFRRLRHILKLFGKEPLFICASATIADSKGHLSKLFGVDFEIVDQSKDTSQRKPIQLDLLCPPLDKDLFSEISSLLSYLSKDKSNRFIAFVDSRKQTELLASIVSRENDDTKEVETDIDGEQKFKWDRLQELNILPYRAGYEEDDRLAIQGRFSNGTLAGVISTSALELGIDIPYLTIGVLVGVPYSSTSFYQRVDRIGRHAPRTYFNY